MTSYDPSTPEAAFDPDQIAHTIEICDVYDGVAVYVMKDGTWINRFRLPGGEGFESRAQRVDEWIAKYQKKIGDQNA